MNAREFFYAFGKALYRVDAVYADFAKEMGVSSSTLLWILYALNDGKQHTQKEICTDWDLPKSTVNTVMSELKKTGIVELVPIKGKRREMTIVLTKKGQSYADDLLSGIYKKEAEVFEQLNKEDQKMIDRLEKLVVLLRK